MWPALLSLTRGFPGTFSTVLKKSIIEPSFFFGLFLPLLDIVMRDVMPGTATWDSREKAKRVTKVSTQSPEQPWD